MKYYKRVTNLSSNAVRIDVLALPKSDTILSPSKGLEVALYKKYNSMPSVSSTYQTLQNTNLEDYTEISRNTFNKYLLSAQNTQRKMIGVDKKGKFRNNGNR